MKTKIAFYLNNRNSIDCRTIAEGNPGLGGSEYLIILVPTLLSMRYNDIDVTLYTNYQGELPKELHSIPCDSFHDFASQCSLNKEDYCVVSYTSVQNEIIKTFSNLKFLIWCHNFVSWKNLDFYANQQNIVRIITVGREQLDLYRDHPAFNKSDYIFNTIPTESLKERMNNIKSLNARKNGVVYIGSLIECKGFLHIAKAWKKVLKAVPDASLYVIGRGNLYNEYAKLGPFKLAEEKFENKFIPCLSYENRLLPSVIFLGVLGNEKFDVIKDCKVGVPNPGGLTETFGLTAIEMQAMGCIVTTIKCPGYLDTVYDKSMLYGSPSQLADYIIRGLKATDGVDLSKVFGFIESNFSYDTIIPQWHQLFTDCLTIGSSLHSVTEELANSDYHFKQWKEAIRKKRDLPIVRMIPSLERVLYKQH